MTTSPAPARPSPARGRGARGGGRPRTLVIGELPAQLGRRVLAPVLDLSATTAEGLAGALATPPEVALVDGSMPPAQLAEVLARLHQCPGGQRPAVLVLGTTGRRRRLEKLLDGQADDYLPRDEGPATLIARIRGALRIRHFVAELSRRKEELESLYAQLQVLSSRMADELRLAASVQRSLLPPPFEHPRLEVAREFIPFREIGGDYYDLLPLGPDRVAFAIGDVMGKGVPAALLAANLKVSLRAQLQSGEPAADEVVGRVNRLYWEVTPKGRFASLFFGVFDLEAGNLEYANAGHHHPFVVRADGRIEDLGQGGTALGLMDSTRYEKGRVALQPDDLVVFYSDGVTERGNGATELFGVERLKEAAVRSRGDGARITLYTLLGEIQGWSQGTPPEDDLTLVVSRFRTPRAPEAPRP